MIKYCSYLCIDSRRYRATDIYRYLVHYKKVYNMHIYILESYMVHKALGKITIQTAGWCMYILYYYIKRFFFF